MQLLEWPMSRHNWNVSGRISGKGNIGKPAVVGEIQCASGHAVNLWIQDLNGDGQNEYVFVERGRIQVKDKQDILLWKSDICNPFIIGFHDLDGSNKEKCVVAVANFRILKVYSGTTGEVYWSHTFERKTVMLSHSTIRVGAIHPDLQGEQITVWPEGDEYGYLFSFEEGVRNGRIVWKNRGIGLGERTRYRPNVLFGDLQGFGFNAIIVIQHSIIWVVDYTTGEIKWQIDGPNLRNYGIAGLYDVDHDGVMELVFVNDSVQLRVSVVKWQQGRFEYIWSNFIGYGDHLMTTPYLPVRDIDGDGKLEIMYTVGDISANAWKVEILDAATGDKKYTIDDARILDCGDVDGDGIIELLWENVLNSEVVLSKPGDDLASGIFRTGSRLIPFLEGNRPIDSNHTNIPRGTTYLQDMDGDGRSELFVTIDGQLFIYECGTDHLFVSKWQVGLDDSLSILNAFHDADGKCSLLCRQAAKLQLYSAEGELIAQFEDCADITVCTPVITDIDGDGIAEMMIGDSVYGTKKKNSTGGFSFHKKWFLNHHAQNENIFFNSISGVQFLAAWDFDQDSTKELLFGSSNAELVCTNCKGEILWRKKLKGDFKGGSVVSCAVGKFLSSDSYDIFANVASTKHYINECMVIEAATGEIVWRRNDGHDSGMGPVGGYASVRTLENDRLDDLLFLSGDMVVEVDGATGKDLIEKKSLGDILGTRWVGSGQLTLVDVDADGKDEIFLSGIWGLNGGVLKRDKKQWKPLWFDYYGNETPIGTPPSNSHQGIAWADGRVLAAGQRADYQYGCVDASTGQLLWTYDIGDSLVGDTCTGDIDGDGYDEFIFGCNDGHVYALKHDGMLFFKLFIDAPIGCPVLADVDDDGKLEIVVTRNDGKLLVIK